MPKFAANLSLMFTEVPFLERFGAAKRAGFSAVEFLFPYEHDPQEIRAELSKHGLELVLFNLRPGDWEKGERGIAIFPARIAEFREAVAQAINYAIALECRNLHCLAGITRDGEDTAPLRETYVANLRYAAAQLAEAGLSLLIEPINTRDIPGYFLHSTADAEAVIAAVDAPNLRLQYDVYHMHIMECDVQSALPRLQALISHVQIADAPGRHEPGTGEIDFPSIFRQLDELGYEGWVGCEYRPRTRTSESLTWFARPQRENRDDSAEKKRDAPMERP